MDTISLLSLVYLIVLIHHNIPQVLKVLKPIWSQWEKLGLALHISSGKLETIRQRQATSDVDKLLAVVKVFGARTGCEGRTWRRIYEAVTECERIDIANEIEKDHSNLDEPRKLLY